MSTKTMNVRFPNEIPIAHTPEILVLGGGPGGICAAVAAAREGRDVLLAEHYGFLGGMATAGEVNPFMPNHLDGKSLDEGIYQDWLRKMDAVGARRENTLVFDPFLARLAAEALCLEAGVQLLYHHRVIHAETHAGSITGVVLHSKGGLCAAQAQLYIDSTGDGDLCALADCEFEFGGEDGAFVQPMTTCFKLRLDPADLPPAARDAMRAGKDARSSLAEPLKEAQRVYSRAKDEGQLRNHRENVLVFAALENDVLHFNSTRVIRKSPIDGKELSEAEIEGRAQIRELVDLLRDHVPAFAHARICSIATQIGIRESRRIRGRAYVTREEFMRGMTFPDGIVRATYPIDIHSSGGRGTEITHLPRGAWYEIPYGCIVPKDMDNLLVGSRCISVDSAIHASVRVMPPVCSLGQAAGTAAAMALENKSAPHELDGAELKERLIKNGRNLVDYDSGCPSTVERVGAGMRSEE